MSKSKKQTAKIFTFDARFKNREKQTKFYMLLYGYDISSYFGRYKYHKKGLLDNMPYLKPTDSTIIISRKHAPLLRIFFKKYKAKFTEHLIMLHRKEARALRLFLKNSSNQTTGLA